MKKHPVIIDAHSARVIAGMLKSYCRILQQNPSANQSDPILATCHMLIEQEIFEAVQIRRLLLQMANV